MSALGHRQLETLRAVGRLSVAGLRVTVSSVAEEAAQPRGRTTTRLASLSERQLLVRVVDDYRLTTQGRDVLAHFGGVR